MGSQRSFLDDYLPYLLRRADQMLSAPFYALLTDHGIARSDWRVLAVLEDVGELSVLDLASESLSPQPTVTHALRRLEGRGLVRKTAGVEDKRQRFVSITPAGSALASTLMDQAKALETAALAATGNLEELVGQLRALTATVESQIAVPNV